MHHKTMVIQELSKDQFFTISNERKKYWDLSFTFSATRTKNLWLAAPRGVPWQLFSAFCSETESLYFIHFCRITSMMEVSDG